MPGITNYLNNLNKRIEISSTEISNIELKESFALNSRRVAADLSSVGAYLNNVIVQSYFELCSRPTFPYDAVVDGLSGMTIKTWPEALGNNKFNSPVFWFASENPDVDGRPCTVKESLQYLWESLNDRIIESRENPADLAPIYSGLTCLNEMLDRLKIDSFGDAFLLNCAEGYEKQKWPVSKHVYEVLTQLTVGHEDPDLAGLNNTAEPYPDLEWNIELNDLLDVDTESSPPVSGDALLWNEELSRWSPGPVSDSQQRLGGLLGGTSTLVDVHDMDGVIDAWRSATGVTGGFLDATPEQIFDLFKSGANRYRPGAMLQFGGNDVWYSGLAGNVSNLNAVSFVPELWSKTSAAIVNNTLTPTELTEKVEGGLKPIPFVFVNSFRLSLKEKTDPTFPTIIYSGNLQSTLNLITDPTLNAVYSNFDTSIVDTIFNTNPSASKTVLENEMLSPEENHPLAITACSSIYEEDVNGTIVKKLEYKPNYLLGVSRSDVSYLPETTNAASSIFENDANNDLTGNINQEHISAIMFRVSSGVGNEVQHSGYTRCMILGPYNVGDNVYVCPEPILRANGIKYPYGICVSDTYMKKSIPEIIDPNGRFAIRAPNAMAVLQDVTLYDMSETIVTSLFGSSELLAGLKNKILNNPVGFITKDDSPRSSSSLGNIANEICRALLGSNLAVANTSLPIHVGVGALAQAILTEASLTAAELHLNEKRGMLESTHLHLPTIKIQLPSFKYEAQEALQTESFNENITGWSMTHGYGLQGATGPAGPQGDVGPAGSQGPEGPQGSSVVGPQGPTGNAGAAGTPGSDGDGKVGGTIIFNTKDNYYSDKPSGDAITSSTETIGYFSINPSSGIYSSYPNEFLLEFDFFKESNAAIGYNYQISIVAPDGTEYKYNELSSTTFQSINVPIVSGSYFSLDNSNHTGVWTVKTELLIGTNTPSSYDSFGAFRSFTVIVTPYYG